ncbi:hypothetical protein D1007_40326 [Hordeum vulgare]|nr:hypothetical protein D1007_40326 [Hordeum vulgare]
MNFNKDFDPELVAQLYAIVQFSNDEEMTLTWMTHGRQMHAKWKEVMNGLGYKDHGLENTLGLYPPRECADTHKSKLTCYQRKRKAVKGQEKGKTCFLNVSHVMWSKLHTTVMDRKCPFYGPFLLKLIEDTWHLSSQGRCL